MTINRLFICLFCLFGLLVFTASEGGNEPGSKARRGLMDFGGRLNSLDKSIALNGEWEFYWHQFLVPEDFKNKKKLKLTGYFNLPGYWNEYLLNEKNLNGKGFATFRLVIDNIMPYQIVSLDIPSVNSAYRLYINGVFTSRCGSVGLSEESSIPDTCPHRTRFYLEQNQIKIILQVSNFHHNKGGIWRSMELVDHLRSDFTSERKLALDLFIIGAILIMGFYYMGVFWLRTQERSALFFGLFCIFMSLRTSFLNTMFFKRVYPGIGWEHFLKLDYLTLTILPVLFSTYLFYLYPKEFSRKVLLSILGASSLLTVITLVSQPYFITAILTIYQLLILATCLYTIYVVAFASIKKRNGAPEMAAGCIILIATIFNDILYAQSIINTTYITGFGLLIFFISQSFVFTKRFTNALLTSEELSVDLEMKVKDQTSEIRDLLDSTGQGILSFDENMKVQDHASRATYFIFEKSIYGENVLNLMFPETSKDIGGTLEVLFQSGGKIRLVKDMLPEEFVRNDKYYDLAFRWIPAGKKTPNLVMVILTDVTVKRKLEKMLEKDELKNQKIIRIAVDRHGFVRFYNHIQYSLSTIVKELKKSITKIDTTEVSRQFHTIKGGLSSYSFFDVANIAHQAEDLLEKLMSDKEALPEKKISDLFDFTEEIGTKFKQEILELGDLIPSQLLSVSNIGFYTISEKKIDHLEQFLMNNFSNSPELKDLMGELRKQPLRNMMKKMASDAKYIAYQLGKQIEVHCSGDGTQIIHAPLEDLFSNLIHLVRNAVHHGIEHPNERKKIGKPEAGSITIDATLKDGVFKMLFVDDGNGIDVEKLKTQAIEKGLLNPAKAKLINDNEALRLILLPGFSTKNKASSLSGRGIGMHAIASSVNELKGTIDIRTELGKGTALTIAIPVLF